MASEISPLLETNKTPNPNMSARFASALSQGSGVDGSTIQLPQTIAHRGYKAAFPENTLRGFSAAVDVGAHAVETDIHLSRDKVVVLSHDATLTRCFGEKKRLADCDWDYLSRLQTVREPKQHMPRLVDLLSYLAQPENEHVWLLLDIKRDDDPDELLSHTAAAIASIKPSKPWEDRIVLGAWTMQTIDLCRKHLPGFPIAFINWSVSEASKLLSQSDVDFNMLQPSLVGPCGTRFINAARRAGRNLFVWTVNKERWMEWSIRKGVDGVITDDPKLFLEVCDRWKAGSGQRSTTLGQFATEVFVQVMMAVLAPLVWFTVRRLNRKKTVPVKV